MAPPFPARLERELGTPGGYSQVLGMGGGLPGYVLDDGEVERTPELAFPANLVVYDRMRRTDGQLAALLRAITLPIRRVEWRLRGDDVRPEVLTFVESELGLDPLAAGRARRRRAGVSFSEALRHALLMLPFGFSPLEQVYEIGPPNPGQTAPEGTDGLVAHLRKLAPRLPRTVTGIRVAADGGLLGVTQARPAGTGRPGDPLEVLIPVDRLVLFTNDREGADYAGNSILRAAYKHWLIKDALIRLGPMIVERNGMGVPVVYYGEGGNRGEALRVAKAFRAGAEAGAALPDTMRLELAGVQGSTRDELPLIAYHDQAISRSALAMFLDLGHDNGARSLGDTFVDLFVEALEAVVTTLEETFTEHVIRDLVELNYGPEEAYPFLEADPLSAESTPTADGLKALADSGLLGPIDPDLVADVRRRYGLPMAPELELDPTVAPPPPEELGPPLEPGRDVTPLLSAGDPLVDRLEQLTARVAELRRG